MCNKMSAMSCVHGRMKDFGLLALRLALGVIFIYAGYEKLGPGHAMAAGMFGKMIGPESAGAFWAYFVGLAEFVGGLMVLLGVFATYASAWLSVIMVVALVLLARTGGGFMNLFTPIAVLGGTLALLGSGAGSYRLVQCECHCPKCKAMCGDGQCEPKAEMGGAMSAKEMGGCCGGGACGDKK